MTFKLRDEIDEMIEEKFQKHNRNYRHNSSFTEQDWHHVTTRLEEKLHTLELKVGPLEKKVRVLEAAVEPDPIVDEAIEKLEPFTDLDLRKTIGGIYKNG